jgi:hypothetical protein
MKITYPVFTKLVLASALLALAVACGKKGDNKEAPVDYVRGQQGGYGAQLGQQSLGVVQGSSSTFQNEIKKFLSASYNPQNIGFVDPMNGVKIAGYVEFDQQGTVVGASAIELTIQDNLSFQGQQAPAIKVFIPLSNKTRSYVSGSTAVLIFEDQYGAVRLSGQVNSNQFTGTIEYRNAMVFSGGTGSPANGTLGRFSVPTCGFFRCQ